MTKPKFPREQITVEVDSFNFEYDTLQAILKNVESMIRMYGETAFVMKTCAPYSNDSYFGVFRSRSETNEEYLARMAVIEQNETAQEIHDRKEFERLSKKFG